MIITLNNKTMIEENPYETASIKKLIPPSLFGMGKDWYGGSIAFIGELKDSKLLLIISKQLKTIDIGVKKEDLEILNFNMLKDIAKHKKIAIEKTTTKAELADKLREVF